MAMKTNDGRSLHDVHPAVLMTQQWVMALKEKTGRSLEEWMSHIAKQGPEGESARREWLKREHGLGTNTAWWLAERSVGKGGEDDDPESYLRAAPAYVDAMYEKKELLRPIHDRLIELGRSLGKDVRVCPCKTIVPLYREHVFAQVKPSTRTRIDFGLALGAMMKGGTGGKAKFPARLIDTGGFAKKDRITHRIAIATLEDVDEEVERWARRAYELDAGPRGSGDSQADSPAQPAEGKRRVNASRHRALDELAADGQDLGLGY